MHSLQACLFKYITVSAFCMVKMPLKGVVGGRVLNGNNIVDHGQIMELCF